MELSWDKLGFDANRIGQIQRVLQKPNGIFLLAGPTGSGKTTTLYTALNELATDDRKIITVEDPIEYSLAGINQVHVDPATDMTFANALRAILRQDPDVIMIGEIRDQETAEIAVRAALVGRLVLSTIHTNDSLSAVDRLIDLGVPRYLLGATLRGVLSQRLLRRKCPECGDTQSLDCTTCQGKPGRLICSEMLEVTTEISETIAGHREGATLAGAATEQGFEPMSTDARRLREAGKISTAEELRTTR